METLLRDLRYSLKVLARRPAITIAAVLCLAIGIGATTTVFSLVHGVLLKPLPYQDPDELYQIILSFPSEGVPRSPTSGKEFDDFMLEKEIFETVGGMIPWSFNLTNSEPPQRLIGARMSASVFRMLGVEPARGRFYTDEEQNRGDALVILTYQIWQRIYGGDESILGKSVDINQQPYTVIGIMGEDFQAFPRRAEIWVPLVPNPAIPRDMRGVQVFVRLKQGLNEQAAETRLDTVESRFAADYPKLYTGGWGIQLEPLREVLVGNVRGRLWAFLGAVVLVLLIACANIANLLIAQATTREKEMTLRAAFGAKRSVLLRQVLTESVVLASLGAGLGLLLALVGTHLITRMQIGDLPRLNEVGISLPVLLFTGGAAILTGILFGIAPALRTSQIHLASTLNEAGRSSASRRKHPLRQILVVAEIALATVVLIGAGLMVRSFKQLQQVSPGFRVDGITTMQLTMPTPLYPTNEARLNFYDRLRDQLLAMPAAENVAIVSVVPLRVGGFQGSIEVEGRDADETKTAVGWTMISPEYFDTLGIPLVQGRLFTDRDRPDGLLTTIVDETMARRLWPGESAVGKRIRLPGSFDENWREVVGVVAPVKRTALDDTTEQLYVPATQWTPPAFYIVVRSNLDVNGAATAVRDALRPIDPYQPISGVSTMEDFVVESLSGPRFNVVLFAFFGIIALVLAAIGVYGVMASSVVERTGEIGVRRALGARRRDILTMVLGSGLKLTGLGLVLGLVVAGALSWALKTVLEDLIFGISTFDLLTFTAVPLILLVTAALANLLPSMRAAQVDPMVALRQD